MKRLVAWIAAAVLFAACSLAPQAMPTAQTVLSTVTAVAPTVPRPVSTHAPTATMPKPPPALTAVSTPTATPHPLEPFTLDALRQRDADGGEIRVRAVLEQTETVTRSYIDYPSDGLTITGLLFAPHGAGPFPVLILLHGFYTRDFYYSGAGTEQAADYFAQNGYLVIAPDLRSWGASDSGLSLFHMGLVNDVRSLIGALPSLPQADADRVGLWGHSMGGGIATKVLVVDSRLKAAVLYAPNSADDADLIARWGIACLPDEPVTAGCNPAEIVPPGTSPQIVSAYQEAAADPAFVQRVAPLYHLEYVNVPVQIHIGSADGAGLAETPPEWSAKLAQGLEAAGKTVFYHEYPDQGHFFTGQSWTTLMVRAHQLFDETLRPDS